MRVINLFLFTCFIILGSFENGYTQQTQSKVYKTQKNVAIGGNDVVAYFTQNDAVRGSQKHTVLYRGVDYWFSNLENKNKFKASPTSFLPEYGGYCAFAMAMKNAKVPSDPNTFKLHDGKLYLFFNDYYQGEPFNTIIPWNADEKSMVNNADTNWEKIK